MTELQSALIGNSAAAPPSHIIEGLEETTTRKRVRGAPHTIYEELWHAAFWQQLATDWIEGLESPYPTHNAETFPGSTEASAETWDGLRDRFLREAQRAAPLRVPRKNSTDEFVAPRGRDSLSVRNPFATSWKGQLPTISTTLAESSSCGKF